MYSVCLISPDFPLKNLLMGGGGGWVGEGVYGASRKKNDSY